ncbi:hypothetical protein Tco_0147989, partial [Tanacetum coccineum]
QNVNSVRPNVNTGRANVNSVRQNVNSVRSNVNIVRPKQLVPTSNSNSFSPVRPQVNNMNERGKFDSGCSTHMPSNMDHLDDFEECKGGSVTFRGSKGYITDMLKKFDLASVKTAITPMETKMALTKDVEADEVDVTPKTLHLNAVGMCVITHTFYH